MNLCDVYWLLICQFIELQMEMLLPYYCQLQTWEKATMGIWQGVITDCRCREGGNPETTQGCRGGRSHAPHLERGDLLNGLPLVTGKMDGFCANI